MPTTARILGTLAAAVALAAATPAAAAFPDKPIRIVVPFSPGGGTDTLARVLAERLGAAAGQPFVVDNHPGAGGTMGVAYTAKQDADGYTIVLVNALNHTASVNLYSDLDYDPVKSFTPIGAVGAIHYELIVNPDFPAKDYAGFVDLVRANPGKYDYASAGVGSSPHLAMELFKDATGLDIVHVPYQGSGPALNDVVAGVVPMIFESSGPAALIKAGRLRALAITGDARSEAFPDVPTFKEAGLDGFDVTGYWGFIAPAGVPGEAVSALNKALNETIADPAIQEKLKSSGIEPVTMTPAEFGAVLESEAAKWAKLIKEAGIKR